MGRNNGIWPEIPEEFNGRLALLDIRIDDDPLELDDYEHFKKYPFSADKWDGTQWVHLCDPDNGPKRYWKIAVFMTIEQCCHAALNATKYGYDWDEGD